jgi:hypothetical protein
MIRSQNGPHSQASPISLQAGLQTRPSLRSRAFPSPPATILFRITSFAYPHHLTPIESHLCKKQGRGWGPRHLHSTQCLPSFSTPSKHPTRRNARISTLFMRLLHSSLDTRGGSLLLTRHSMKSVCPERLSEARDLSVLGTTGQPSAQPSNLSTSKHSNAALPLLTTHYSLVTVVPGTSTLPPSNYGIIPPHRGTAHNPFRAQGGFSD